MTEAEVGEWHSFACPQQTPKISQLSTKRVNPEKQAAGQTDCHISVTD